MKNVSTHSMINANDGELDLRLELEDIGTTDTALSFKILSALQISWPMESPKILGMYSFNFFFLLLFHIKFGLKKNFFSGIYAARDTESQLNYAEKMTQTDLFQPNFPIVSCKFKSDSLVSYSVMQSDRNSLKIDTFQKSIPSELMISL